MQHSEPRRWQALWREAVRDPRELLGLLGLDRLGEDLSDAAAAQFPLRVPRGFVARMRPGDPADPLLRQVLPVLDEERIVPGFALDAEQARDAMDMLLDMKAGRILCYHGGELVSAP